MKLVSAVIRRYGRMWAPLRGLTAVRMCHHHVVVSEFDDAAERGTTA